MTLQYNKDGKLEFELHDLLQGAKYDTKIELIESLACDDDIIEHVVDQILDGWTENCYCGASAYEQTEIPRYGLDIARREISKRSGEIAKQTIEKLEKTIASQKKELDEYRQKEWDKVDREKSLF